MRDIPDPAAAEVEREIRAAFASVTRVGGVSWSESFEIDDQADEPELAAARASNTDRHWSELLSDARWHPDCGSGGFSFLDAVGFRYYLPAAMVLCVRSTQDQGLCSHLTASGKKADTRKAGRWAALDDPQRRCVARFVKHMATVAASRGDERAAAGWAAAGELWWDRYDDDGPGRAPCP